ncbi:hypothetical protein Loa_00013 [Legionella oakridgensis ATCC 33761 = DSM 21215]|uniref:Membrane protein involved in the export of O-antigen and teichoic acid n=2 Tax=Legionella oakridgensis TaxID=29423 RepID=W0BAZ9_9GAMM|nr:hypothetical protein [Legionella oakridgensis]AHE65604.1 hypothetical protein Loa_00013 [Legionella oakridgensis ATCC 33761 = DSM 21215]
MNKEVLLILETGIKKLLKTSLSQMDWLRTSSRLIANNIIFSVTCTIDLLAVEIFSSNESNVGLYAAILTIISFLWLIPTNIYQGLKPNLALMLSDINKRSELQSKLNRTNLVAFILIGIQGFLIIFFSREILLHFGPHYIAAQPALIILTLGVCFSCIARIAPVLLVYAGDEQIVLKWSIVELLLMFLLVIPATYYFDIIGTASATTVVLIIKPFVTILIARKTLNLRPISIF